MFVGAIHDEPKMGQGIVCGGKSSRLLLETSRSKMMVDRRMFLSGMVAAGLAPGMANASGTHVWSFDVARNGSNIGRHDVAVNINGSKLVARTSIIFEIGFGPIVLYRYNHEIEENWLGNEIQTISAYTNRDGRETSLRLARDNNQFVGKLNDKQVQLPLHRPTAYWNMSLPGSQNLIETQDGQVFRLQWTSQDDMISYKGKRIPAKRWQSDGDLELTLLTTEKFGWSGMRFDFKDASFTYTARELGSFIKR